MRESVKQLHTSRWQPLKVIRKLGQGGEGTAYLVELPNGSEKVAKVYQRMPDQRKVERLQAMAAAATPGLLTASAWVEDVIIDEAGSAIGSLMPLAEGKPLHELTTPKSRRQHFPGSDLHFLADVAMRIAEAARSLHQEGQVIGDFNPNNILVTRAGRVTLVDTDSFQISSGGHTYLCEVGTAEFLPPERQGDQHVRRSPGDDVFAAAIHAFMLLYGGRHPFAGRWKGQHASNPPDIAGAIARKAFPYHRRGHPEVDPPPNTPRLEVLPEVVADAFEAIFSGNERPSSEHWAALMRFMAGQVTPCPRGHLHMAGRTCSACQREDAEEARLAMMRAEARALIEQQQQAMRQADEWIAEAQQPVILPPAPGQALAVSALARSEKRSSWLAAAAAAVIALQGASIFVITKAEVPQGTSAPRREAQQLRPEGPKDAQLMASIALMIGLGGAARKMRKQGEMEAMAAGLPDPRREARAEQVRKIAIELSQEASKLRALIITDPESLNMQQIEDAKQRISDWNKGAARQAAKLEIERETLRRS